ncbi:MAG: biopolymer transporter ExbD [Elusimicrobiales bacterium]
MAMQAESDDGEITGINVTPLVDVCLVLVIIFMVTAPMLSDPPFKVQIPVAHTQEGNEQEKIIISIAPDGKLALFEKPYVKGEDMRADLKVAIMKSQSKYVIFRADKGSAYGLLAELMQLSKECGARDMTIATEQNK